MRTSVALVAVALSLVACTSTPTLSPDAVAAVDGETIAPDTVLLRGRFVQGEQPDGNSILVRGRDGLLVFDTGRHPAHTRRILDFAHATRLPVVAIANSHWHLDHVSGNLMLREAYPRAHVHASHAIEQAMTGFLANYRKQALAMIAAHRVTAAQAADMQLDVDRIDAGAKLFPDRPVEAAGERRLAGRRFQVGLTHDAVTGGDVWLYDPATRVLLSGDLVTLPVPLLDTACAPRWSAQLGALDAVDFRTLVPGHGAPLDHAQFRQYRMAFDHLLTCAAGAGPADDCADAWMRDAGPLVPPGDVPLARDLLGYYIGKVLRAPPAQRDRYCPAASM